MIGALGERWQSLLAEAGADGQAVDDTYRNLVRRHQEPWRRYHNLEHVADVLDGVDELADGADDLIAVSLAAWFHDAVYRPHSAGDDEAASALLARDRLRDLGLAADLIAEVARLIETTRHHQPAPDDRNAAVLGDADLAILGSGRWRYARYADGVRFEYRHLSDAAYLQGRQKVLRGFLTRPRIFTTELYNERFDATARTNIRWEQSRLAETADKADRAERARRDQAAESAAPGGGTSASTQAGRS